MGINKQNLEKALSLFNKYDRNFNDEPEEGYTLNSEFFSVIERLNHKRVLFDSSNYSTLAKLHFAALYIREDIVHLATIALRIECQRTLLEQKAINHGIWYLYTTADIDFFHVELRSIFDYIAEIIKIVSDNPGQCPTSFRELQQWLQKSESNARRLGKDLSEVVLSCDWFGEIRNVRDSIVHRGGVTGVEFEDGKTLFRVSLRPGQITFNPHTAYKADLADFELYAGLYIGYALAFLEEIAELVHKRQNLNQFQVSKAGIGHPGLIIIRRWIQTAYNIAE